MHRNFNRHYCISFYRTVYRIAFLFGAIIQHPWQPDFITDIFIFNNATGNDRNYICDI